MTLEPGTIVGSYRIEATLGRGGMGIVYRARHVDHERQVALKVLSGELGSDAEFVARFRSEGELQASLQHPRVVAVYEAGESEHGLYLAMRLVAGSTLAVLLADHVLDAERALALLRQVAAGLDAAHAAGLVHRDVKPANVLVGDADDAYLADFGLTRTGQGLGLTSAGKVVGTVAYLAPEVIRGGAATPASDRYAFAAMAFEALTGGVVYPRPSEAAILFAHTSEPVPLASRRRPELPAALDDLFARALSKEPGQRPRTATALVDSLAAACPEGLGPPPPLGAAGLDGETAAPALLPPSPSRRRMAPWLAAAALAGAGLAVGITAIVGDGAGGGAPQAAALLSPLAGARVIGSRLLKSGRPLDCRGVAVQPSSPSCTIVQSALPGATLVAPSDGVIRRWAVRSARGELALVVVRPRGDVAKQVARSQNEFVTDDGVHVFATDLAVRQGDLVGALAVSGSAVGARAGVRGAATRRWIPILSGGEKKPTFGPGTGFDDELLLRVEYIPGGAPRVPRQVTGAAARRLAPGRVRAQRSLHFTDGRAVTIKLVRLGDSFAFDEFIGGRRTARIDVPGFRPDEGRIIELEVYAEDAPAQLGIYIEFNNNESERILSHFYAVFPHEFTFYE